MKQVKDDLYLKNDLKLESNIEGNGFQLIWNGIKFVAQNKNETEKTIINDVCGTLKSGQIMAFLGPSGSGKSTLLECIIGKRKKGKSGFVGLRVSKNIINDPINIAFIPQKDYLLELLTVRESILFSTKILISKRKYEKQKLSFVLDNKTEKKYFPDHSKYCNIICENIIEELDLISCADTRIRSCSGGQLKRVSIAQELPSEPKIIFLDEPTSGLDSNSSFSLIKILKNIIKEKNEVAIMLSIHQPSIKIFNSFDLVYVLSKKGTPIYQGSPLNIVNYLKRFNFHCPDFYNAADYFIEIANLDYGEEQIPSLTSSLKDTFNENIKEINSDEFVSLANFFKKNQYPELKHAYYLTLRSLITTLRDPLVFGLRFSSHIFMAYFLSEYFGRNVGIRGGCSPEVKEFNPSQLDYTSDEIEEELKNTYNNVSALFFVIVFVSFSSIMPICIAFPSEMQVFTRESNNAWYTLKSYFFGKTLSEVPFQLVMPALFAYFFFILSNQYFEYWRIINFIGLTIITSFISQSFGYIIGSILMKNITASLFFGPLSCFPIMVLAGVFVKIKDIPELYRPITALSYMKHSMNGLIISIYGFDRCSNTSNIVLKNNKEAFQVWLSAMLGVYGDENGFIDLNDTNRPTESFVESVVSIITDPFISKTNKTQSLAMNEFDLEDDLLIKSWFYLIIYLIFVRILAYIAIRLKTEKNLV